MGKILISCDMNCCRITEQMYSDLMVKLTDKNDDYHVHIYNFISKKHTFIKDKYCEITHPYTGSHKRVVVDLEQALDTVKNAIYTKYDMVYLLTGECESDTLHNKLLSIGVPSSKVILTPSGISISVFYDYNSVNTTKPLADHAANYKNISNNEITALTDKNNTTNYAKKGIPDNNSTFNDSCNMDKKSHLQTVDNKDNCDKTQDMLTYNQAITTVISDNNNNKINPTTINFDKKTINCEKFENDCSLITTLPPDKLKLVLQYLLDKKTKSKVI